MRALVLALLLSACADPCQGQDVLRSPAVGTVVSLAGVDSVLTPGETVAVIESMGLDIALDLPHASRVVSHCSDPGQAVAAGQSVLAFGP